jgi:hypothetical protein
MDKYEWAAKAMLSLLAIYFGGAYMISKWGPHYEEIARYMVVVFAIVAGVLAGILAIGMGIVRSGIADPAP